VEVINLIVHFNLLFVNRNLYHQYRCSSLYWNNPGNEEIVPNCVTLHININVITGMSYLAQWK
jgi:hypothetical protein